MFELSKTELELLEKIGKSGNGRELVHLLRKMKNDIDKSSNIPTSADYGAEVKGRTIAAKIIDKLLDGMVKTTKGTNEVEDLDDWS